MNKWQMEGRAMPERWKGSDYDIPPGGKKSHLQLSIHPGNVNRPQHYGTRRVNQRGVRS